MLTFPASPVTGQQFQTWTWDGVKWVPTSMLSVPNCGYFQVNGAPPNSSVIFKPYNGDLIRINGLNYRIPSAGITAASNNCFFNGTPNTVLNQSTTYYAYVYIHATLGMTLDFSATGHATSTQTGNIGVEIKSGDNTRTLVGMVWTGGTAPNSFYNDNQNRLVRSWFNRRSVPMHGVGGGTFTANAAQVPMSCVNFQNEAVYGVGNWYGTSSPPASNVTVWIYLNGAQSGNGGSVTTTNTTASYENCQAMTAGWLNEGLNTLYLYGQSSGGQASGGCSITGMLG